MDTTIDYTTEIGRNETPIPLYSLINVKVIADGSSSSGWLYSYPTLTASPILWQISHAEFPINRERFIGMLSDIEAREMKRKISLFRKKFDEDLARRNKILFGK